MHLGLRNGGGIGDSLPRLSYKYHYDTSMFAGKIIFEYVFFILINLIILNIFIGVIVDRFSEYRDQSILEENDKTNKCFLCNIDRFNPKSGNFDKHRESEHNTFDYVYIYFFLKYKNQQEFSSVESHVWQEINMGSLNWLPEAPKEEE
jgi:inositol 1,4,5-triphosphate receptor type 1